MTFSWPASAPVERSAASKVPQGAESSHPCRRSGSRGSLYYKYFKTGKLGAAHTYTVEGIGEDFLPSTMNFDVVDDVLQVSDQESFLMARRLVKEEALFVGAHRNGGGGRGAVCEGSAGRQDRGGDSSGLWIAISLEIPERRLDATESLPGVRARRGDGARRPARQTPGEAHYGLIGRTDDGCHRHHEEAQHFPGSGRGQRRPGGDDHRGRSPEPHGSRGASSERTKLSRRW